MKRILSVLLIASMLAIYMPAIGGITIAAEASGAVEWQYDAFVYDNNTDDTADDITGIAVTRYIGTQTDIYVPAEIDDLPVLKLGEGLFKDNTAINSVALSNNIKVIGKDAFSGCTNLVCIVTNEGLMEIEENAFLNCVSFNSVILYDAVTAIADTAFSCCESLTIYCNEGTEGCAYATEKGVAYVILNPEATPEIVTVDGIEYYIMNGEAYATDYVGELTEVIIPATVNGYPVTELRSTFYECSAITSVTLPNSITAIGDNAFYKCTSLEGIEIPESVTALGESAFAYCSSISKIDIPDGVVKIGEYAFRQCEKLAEVTLPESLMCIEDNAFASTALKSVTLPSGVTDLGNGIFYSCSNLEELILPENLKRIPSELVGFCGSLKQINIPESVETIECNAFMFSGIEAITLPDNIKTISGAAFWNCEKLTEIIMPANLEAIGSLAFNGCINLKHVDFSKATGLTTIEDTAFTECESIVTVYIPSMVNLMYSTSFDERTYLFVDEESYAHTFAEENSLNYYVLKDYEEYDIDQITYGYNQYEGWYVPQNFEELTKVEILDKICCMPVTKIKNYAFQGDSIKEVIIPEGITTLENHAFYLCIELDEITIPKSVTSMHVNTFRSDVILYVYDGSYAHTFAKENSLLYSVIDSDEASVYVVDGITYLIADSKAIAVEFDGSLTSVTIPSEVGGYPVVSVGVAFKNNTTLKSIVLPDSMTEIADMAFYGCTGLNSVTIPDSVTSIGDAAFRDCTKLVSVTLPSGLTKISPMMFSGCTALSDITIPEGVEEIGASAFSGCSDLVDVTIPDGVKIIGANAFTDCEFTKVVNLPAALESMKRNSFYIGYVFIVEENSYAHNFAIENDLMYFVKNGDEEPLFIVSDNIEYYIMNGIAIASDYLGNSSVTEVTVPSEVEGYSVKQIRQAFKKSYYITTVIVSDGIEYIGEEAFSTCMNLKSVELADSVEYIGEKAFYKTVVSRCNTPANLSYVGDYAFSGANLTTMVLPEGCTKIGNYVFEGCSFTSLTIPGSIEEIGSGAFRDCTLLTELVVEDGVKTIGYKAFESCDVLERVTIADSVRTLDSYAFAYCEDLMEVKLPEGIEAIGSAAFFNCDLRSIVIPDSVKIIGSDAFASCNYLSNVVLPEELTYIGSYAFWNTSLSGGVYLPGKVEEIGSEVFSEWYDSSISVIVPESVETLYSDSFTEDTVLYVFRDSYAHTFALENEWTHVVLDVGYSYTVGYYSFSFDENMNVTLTNNTNYEAEVIFPKSVGRYPIKVIASSSGSSGVTSMVIPEGVEEIADYGLTNYSGLKTVVLPESITTLHENSFNYKNIVFFVKENSYAHTYLESRGYIYITSSGSSMELYTADGVVYGVFDNKAAALYLESSDITEIVIPDTVGGYPVTSVRGVFQGCSTLTKITLPDSITKIEEDAFSQCGALTEVVLPKNLTEIGDYAFGYCYKLEKIDVPDTVVTIGSGAFSSCCNIAFTSLPSGVTRIENWTFSGCSGLTEITLHDGINYIGDGVFQNCSNLVSVTLPKGLTSIKYSTFRNCKKLEKLVIPESVESIADDAIPHSIVMYVYKDSYAHTFAKENDMLYFVIDGDKEPEYYNVDGVVYFILEGNAVAISCDTTLTSVTIPSMVEGYPVTELRGTFGACNSLKSVVLPEGLTKINSNAFLVCGELSSVNIPDSVTYIGDYAFSNCKKLKSIDIPASVTYIGEYAFNYCTALTSIVIPEGISVIKESAFSGCYSLDSINIPDGVTKIENYAFSGLDIEEIEIPDSVTELGHSAFYGTSLTEVKIPDSVKIIGSSLFERCTSLKRVELPKDITIIPYGIFSGCTSLERVVIPNKVTSIEMCAFSECDSIKSVIIPSGVYAIHEQAFANCDSLTEVVFENGVEQVASDAFSGCSGVTKVLLPESLYDLSFSVTAFSTDAIYYIDEFSCWKSWLEENSLNYIEMVPGGEYTFGGITYSKWDDEIACVNKADSTIKDIYIMGHLGRNKVTEVNYGAFLDSYEIETVILPDTLEIIHDHAFNNTTLEEIIIPEGVTHIGNYALNIDNLKMLEIPKAADSISIYEPFSYETVLLVYEDSYAKEYAEEHGYVYFVTDGITKPEFIVEDGIEYCITNGEAIAINYTGDSAAESVTVPERVGGYPVTRIVTAFSDTNIKNIVLPDTLREIGYKAFSGCDFTEIHIPDSVTRISKGAFSGCSYLSGVTIPDGVIKIEESVFSGCSALAKIVIPDNITKIGDSAFSRCSSLTGITIPDSVTELGKSVFSACSSITEIAIPDSATKIGEYIFNNCTNLEKVSLSKNITNIPWYSFGSCTNLTEVNIPESVVRIENGAFSGCVNLKSIKIPEAVSYMVKESFTNNTILYVYENSYAHTFAVNNNLLYFVMHKTANPEIAYGSAITGTVKDNSGNAINGATVEILYDDGVVKESVTTDENGAYEFTYAEVGRYTIRATDTSSNTTHEVVGVKRMNVFDVYLAGETDLVITTSHKITGTVTGGSNGSVTITDENGVVIATGEIVDGSFTIEAIPNGDYVIKAETESGVAVGEVTVFGGEVQLELVIVANESTATVTGMVEDEYGNERIWATVTFYDSDGVAVASTKTDEDGRYSVAGLEIDEYAIVAESNDMRDDKHHGHRRSYVLKGYGYIDITEVGSFEADVIIVYDENDHECSIEGKVTAQGSPQVSEVILHDVFRNEVARYATKNNGKYKFVNIKDGLYFITARTEDNGMGMTVVSVRHGRVHGKTDIWVGRPDKIKEHEGRRHEIGDCSSRDDAIKHKEKIIEEKRFYDSLSKKEKKHCSKEYVDWLHRMIEWINSVEYEVLGDEPDTKFEHGGSMVDCDEIESEEPVRIEVTIEKRDRCEIGEDGVTDEDEFIQQSIEDAAGDGELGQYYNISMRKGDGESYKEVDNIHRDTHTTGRMRITMPIPEEYRGHENYCFVHVHNGEVVKLIDLDDDPDTITFETERFSTFVLMWHDKPFIEDVSKDVVKIGDTLYTSLQEAVNAATDGDEIVLCDDVTLGRRVRIEGKSIRIDTAGYRIVGNISIGAEAYVTICDSSEEKSGIIDGSITADEEITAGMLTVYDGICESIESGALETIGTGEGFKVYRSEKTGAAMVDGAQVRIGDGVGEDGKLTMGSGLRFVTSLDMNDSLVVEAYNHYDAEAGAYEDGYEIGVRITAEGSDEEVYIPATKWQSEGEVFTTALTNLAESNYNRRFTATVYVVVEGVRYETPVSTTRSIYQVAAGLLTETYAEREISAKELVDVLNMYVNCTGIRLVLDETAGFTDIHDAGSVSDKGGKYSGNAFFEIESATAADGVYSVTIKPVGVNTVIVENAAEYIRINNNNSAVKKYVKLTDNEDGTHTITFDYKKMQEN